jgi:Dolichyl-phosphate-mannose-protein mannosyltransferase
VALDVAVSRAGAPARPQPLARLLAVPAAVVLAVLVGASAIVRFLLALPHTTPLYFADEYIYSTLAYELATTGRPTIRGDAANFPALLEPILTAPFWLAGDPELALRLTQGLNAVAMSVAAIPVYLLARELGLGKGFGLAAAAVALVSPDLFYVAFILGEPIAYPLVMWSVLFGVRALHRPTARDQVLFVVLAGLASFARVQFVVLPVAYIGAALVARIPLRKLKLSFALLAVPAAGLVVAGLGYYSGVAGFDVDPAGLAHWLTTDAMLLAYAAGWLIVPGALVGLALARERVERAFAAFTVILGAGLFVEAALYATNASVGPGGRFQERYLFTLAPLLVLAFGLSLRHGGRARGAIALIAVALIAVSARVPLSGYTDVHGRQDSPFLIGVHRFDELLGNANASLTVAAVVALLALLAIGVAYRPRLGVPALALVGAFLGAVSLGAWSLDSRYANAARTTYLPADARWVDHAGLGDVTLLNTPGSKREIALEQMFWNRSITDFARLRDADRADAFAAPRVRIARDGALWLNGRLLRKPLLVAQYAMNATFSGAEHEAGTDLFALWRPAGTPRLSLLTGGRYYDGWLANTGYVRAWRRGRVSMRLSLPAHASATTLRFRGPGVRQRVRLTPGSSRLVEFTATTTPWTVKWSAASWSYLTDGRPVSVRSSAVSLKP